MSYRRSSKDFVRLQLAAASATVVKQRLDFPTSYLVCDDCLSFKYQPRYRFLQCLLKSSKLVVKEKRMGGRNE